MPDRAVTVVIPLFNKVREVSRTLESVLQQSSPPVAVVVVDDGSTDGGDRIVEQHPDPRVRLIRQPNAGPGPARNRGIDEASTDLVALIDADDEWLPGFLETALQLRSRFPQAGLWATNYRMVPENADSDMAPFTPHFEGLSADYTDGPALIDNFFRCLGENCPVCSSNVLGRRSIFQELGGFTGETRIGEDWDMWFRIAVHHPIAFTPVVQAIYRLDASNRAMSSVRQVPGIGTVLDDMTFEASIRRALAGDDLDARYRESVVQLLSRRLILHTRAAIMCGSGRVARQLLREPRSLNCVREHWCRLWVQSFLGHPINRALSYTSRIERMVRQAICGQKQ